MLSWNPTEKCQNIVLYCTVGEYIIAVAIVGRAITIWEAIQKGSHEPIYKTHTIIKAKRLRATTSAIVKLEER